MKLRNIITESDLSSKRAVWKSAEYEEISSACETILNVIDVFHDAKDRALIMKCVDAIANVNLKRGTEYR